MRPPTLVLGVFLVSAGVNVLCRHPVAGIVVLAFALTINLVVIGVLLQAVSANAAIPRRIGLFTISAASLTAAIVALTLSMLIDGDPYSEYPWLSVFYFGVFVAALFLAPIAFFKGIWLE